MSAEVYQKIRSNPKFQESVAKRRRFSWTLALIVLFVFYAFILVVAFQPHILAAPLSAGSTTTIGVPIGLGIIVFFWLLTGFYIRRANSEFDASNEDLIREALQ